MDALILLLSLVAHPSAGTAATVTRTEMQVTILASLDGQRESVFAWRQMRSGKMLPLKEIERRVVPTMKGAQYIGVTLDPDAAIYTLKFLRDSAVIWVDVDARSGQVLGRTGR